MIEIRSATDSDKPAIWQIIKAVISTGETYVFHPDTSEDEMLDYWFAAEKHVYVAEENKNIVGTFWLKPNYPGLAHTCATLHTWSRPMLPERGSVERWRSSRSTKREGSASKRCNSTSS
jgi:hypothetical protein